MDRNTRNAARGSHDGAPPSAAWLFAQALLGRPVTSPASAQADARAKREQLEWLASISTEHERQLRRLQCEEADARRKRVLLTWLASFSTEHERQLRRIQAAEAEAAEAQRNYERFAESSDVQEANWDPSKHPRGGFSQNRGWWSPSGGAGGGGSTSKFATDSTDHERKSVDTSSAPPRMIELATAWHKTNELLDQCRRNLDTLPARIESERAQLGTGGRYAYIHSQNLAKAEQELKRSQELIPQLEQQSKDLQREYSDSGFDEVDYAEWTPGETRVAGRGIEQVGRAVAASGSPAGLTPTDDESLVAAAVSSVFRIGRAVLGKAISKLPGNVSHEAASLKPYGGAGGGHHVPAKKAFEGAAGYDAKAALAIPNEEMAKLEVRHSAVTGAQKKLYADFAKTGAKLTWDDVERIETDSLVHGGMNPNKARATVRKSINALKEAGVPAPTRIPWGN